MFSFKVEKNDKNIFVGNIISDIKSTFHSMYDIFNEIKKKWQSMEILKTKEEYKNDSIEMCYIKNNINPAKEENM